VRIRSGGGGAAVQVVLPVDGGGGGREGFSLNEGEENRRRSRESFTRRLPSTTGGRQAAPGGELNELPGSVRTQEGADQRPGIFNAVASVFSFPKKTHQVETPSVPFEGDGPIMKKRSETQSALGSKSKRLPLSGLKLPNDAGGIKWQRAHPVRPAEGVRGLKKARESETSAERAAPTRFVDKRSGCH